MTMEAIGTNSRVYVFADTTQIIEFEIRPQKMFVAEAGLEYWIEEGITFETRNCDHRPKAPGRFGKLLKQTKPKPGCGSSGINYFTNNGRTKKQLAFVAPESREILPIDIAELNGYFMCSKNAFMCASGNIEISIDRRERAYDLKNYVLAKRGFILMRLKGHGKIFVHVGGRFVKKFLKNQTLRIDRRSIVGFESGIRLVTESSGILKTLRSTFNGSYEITLKGSGALYLQSKPYIRKQAFNWLARGLREILDAKSLQPYMNNLRTIKNKQWSKFRDTLMEIQKQKKKKNRKKI
jgi:uncharacterized protein (AIM24 family)